PGNWEIVTTIDGAGNSNQIINYSAVDENVTLNGVKIYYRLKQTDYDSAFTYSDIISANCEELESDPEFELIDVIANSQNNDNTITVIFNSTGNENYTIELFDIIGRLLVSEKKISDYGLNNVKINIGKMSEEMYLVVLKNETKVFTKKIMYK
ncbi:MAG: T9SS type A sorting domain-containing protein, partial [Bacteroidota bacterium]